MAQDGGLGPFITNRYGDRYLDPINRATFAPIGYAQTLGETYRDKWRREDTFYIIIGTDSGLFVKQLQKQGVPAGSRYLFVELPEVIARLPEVLELAALDPAIAVVAPFEIDRVLDRLRFKDYVYLNRDLMLNALAAMDVKLPAYLELAALVRRVMAAIRFKEAALLSNRLFWQRRLENLADNRVPAAALSGRYRGQTAVLLGAGPSLDAILPWILKNRERVTVLAVSRLAGRMKQVGLVPDFFVSVDPNPINFDNSRAVFGFWQDAVLVHSDTVSPPLLGQWRGRSLFLGHRCNWGGPFDEANVEIVGPTVTNAALDFAVALGFRRVLLAGVDLCFSPEGITHCQGNAEHGQGPAVFRDLMVTTNDGRQAGTTEAMSLACTKMSVQAGKAGAAGCQVINLAPSAVRLETVGFQPITAIRFEPHERRLAPLQLDGFPAETLTARQAYLQRAGRELERAATGLQTVVARCREAVERIATVTEGRPAHDLQRQLDRMEQQLDQSHGDVIRALKGFGIAEFMKTKVEHELAVGKGNKATTYLADYYRTYLDAARDYLALVEQARERVAARLLEGDPDADPQCLARQWRTDLQPGRIFLHEDRLAEQSRANAPAWQEWSAALKAEYRRLIDGPGLEGQAHLRQEVLESEMQAIAASLYKRRDAAGLEQLLHSLETCANESRPLLLAMTRGYLAELRGDSAAAQAEFQAIVEQGQSDFLEIALLMISRLCLAAGAQGDALLAMECLAGLDAIYEPRLAEMLVAVGEAERALDVYAGYLEKRPDDLAVLVRLADLYQSLGFAAGVEAVREHILTIDPSNPLAGAVAAPFA